MTDTSKRKEMTYEQKQAAKNIHEASFKKFSFLLINKANKYHVEIIKADKYYPSTQKCNKCGNIKKMKINDRIYKCDKCNLIIDRDLNSAINLALYK